MTKSTINLGILAHVDAGKTSLTERLLFEHGVIERLGSVDAGNTTTDSGDLERERGITIRSAVASFQIEDLQVNLIDTPGHPDFIAEVERALSVLDGVILVVSAVEGVQAQTKVLLRSFEKIGLPALIFVNKVDRPGARTDDLLAEITRRLTPRILPLNSVVGAGSVAATITDDATQNREFNPTYSDAIIVNDEDLLGRMLDGNQITYDEIFGSLATQARHAAIYPVFFGSAILGIGIDSLSRGIQSLLPSTPQRSGEGQVLSGTVFAIERSHSGEKIGYIRLFDGLLKERQIVTYSQQESTGQIKEHEESVSSIELVGFNSKEMDRVGSHQQERAPRIATAGDIAKVRGLSAVRVGARLGNAEGFRLSNYFPPPSLETVVRPLDETKKTKLYTALAALSDEDPLIQARIAEDGALSIKLYGEVQKEVISERLKREFGVDLIFSATKPVYFERPVGVGASEFEYDTIFVRDNTFPISIGIRIEPNTIGSGNRYVREAKWGLMPSGFYRTIEESAMKTLSQGCYGWDVTDCTVYLTKVAFERPLTVAAHFRYLTAILVMRALADAGTEVFEPYNAYELEIPEDTRGAVIGYLASLGAELESSQQAGPATWLLTGSMPVRIVQEVTRNIPGLSHGEGVLMSFPGSDQPMRGKYPVKERTDGNPLDYDNYLKYLFKNRLL